PRRFATGARRSPPLITTGSGLRVLASAACWAVVLLSLLPFFAVVVLSFMKFRGPVLQGGFSLDNFSDLLGRSARPLENTLMLSGLAAVIAAVIGVPIGDTTTPFPPPLPNFLQM